MSRDKIHDIYFDGLEFKKVSGVWYAFGTGFVTNGKTKSEALAKMNKFVRAERRAYYKFAREVFKGKHQASILVR